MRQFWLELSYRYGTPVEDLQKRISWQQFKELFAYERIRPHSSTQTLLYLAQLAQLLAEINRDETKRPNAFLLSDFVLKFGKRRNRVAPEDAIEAVFRAIARKQRGDDCKSRS